MIIAHRSYHYLVISYSSSGQDIHAGAVTITPVCMCVQQGDV